MKDNFEKMLKHILRVAERSGVRPPVIAQLNRDSSLARSIVKDMTGRSIVSPEVQLDPTFSVTAAWSVPTACELLRRYFGIGGMATANLLEGRHAPDYWILIVRSESLSVFGARAGRKSIQSSAYFEKLFGDLCNCCLKQRGPVFLRVLLKNGGRVIVQGKDSLEAAYVATLLRIASTRRLPPLDPNDGERGLPIKDADLAAILRLHFMARPKSVSEALRALRKADRAAYRWLTRVVKLVPPLNADSPTTPKKQS